MRLNSCGPILLIENLSAPALRRKRDGPLQHDRYSIGESNQKINVHGDPGEPRRESAKRTPQIAVAAGMVWPPATIPELSMAVTRVSV
jgi:hypothetical protein